MNNDNNLAAIRQGALQQSVAAMLDNERDLVVLGRRDQTAKVKGKLIAAGKKPTEGNWTQQILGKTALSKAISQNCNIGLLLNADDLVIDIDVRNGGLESFERFCTDYNCFGLTADAPVVVTGSGGYHVYLKKSDDDRIRRSIKKTVNGHRIDLYPGVEFLSVGKQVLIPGCSIDESVYDAIGQSVDAETWVKTQGAYHWHALAVENGLDDIDCAPHVSDAIPGLLDALSYSVGYSASLNGTTLRYHCDPGQLTVDELQAVLDMIDVRDFADYESWRDVVFASHFAVNGSDEGERVVMMWSMGDPQFVSDPGATGRVWHGIKDDYKSASQRHRITHRTLFHFARESIAVRDDAEAIEHLEEIETRLTHEQIRADLDSDFDDELKSDVIVQSAESQISDDEFNAIKSRVEQKEAIKNAVTFESIEAEIIAIKFDLAAYLDSDGLLKTEHLNALAVKWSLLERRTPPTEIVKLKQRFKTAIKGIAVNQTMLAAQLHALKTEAQTKHIKQLASTYNNVDVADDADDADDANDANGEQSVNIKYIDNNFDDVLDDDAPLTLDEVLKADALETSNFDVAEFVANCVLAKHFARGKHLIYNVNGTFWSYNGMHWELIREKRLQRLVYIEWQAIKQTLGSIIQTASLLTQAIKILQAIRAVKNDVFGEMQNHRPVINCLNGELHVNIRTGMTVVKSHSYKSYLPYVLNVEYDPLADAPLWRDALKTIFSPLPDSDDVIRHMHELFGYIIQPRKDIALFGLFYGAGSNGKTMIMNILQSFIGGDAVLSCDIEQLDLKRDRFALEDLPGKLLILDDDVDQSTVLPAGTLKKISENKAINTPIKHVSGSYRFTSIATPIMLANHMPKSRDVSHGLLRRAIVVPFKQRFDDGNRDDTLQDRIIKTELAGILNLLLDGLTRLRKRSRFKIPVSCNIAKDDWLKITNPISAFIDELCVHDIDSRDGMGDTVQDLFFCYTRWASEVGGSSGRGSVSTHSKRSFEDVLASTGFVIKGNGVSSYVLGLYLKENPNNHVALMNEISE